MEHSAATLSRLELIRTIQSEVAAATRLPRALCFDFFDTLVYRTVPAEETKQLAANQLARLLDGISGQALYELRRDLERRLCTDSVAAGNDPEFNLLDLAAELHGILSRLYPTSPVLTEPEDFSRLFWNLERAVERLVQRPYPEMVDLLAWLQARSIPLCLISDFYVPKACFADFLLLHGLEPFFAEVFISADWRVGKGSARLYGHVAKSLACTPEQLWMVGDNPHADQKMAESLGIRTFLLEGPGVDSADSASACAAPLPASRGGAATGTGPPLFPEMGVSLWLFTARLFTHLYRQQVKNVFFCSKEGEFLLKLFEIYQQRMFGEQRIIGHYLLVSRKATFICSLDPLDTEDFSRLFNSYRDLTLEEFVLCLNFSPRQVEDLQNMLGGEWRVRIPNLQADQRLRQLFALTTFQEMYERQRFEQRANLIDYLRSFPVDIENDGLHLVDVGWKGSIQNNLYHALAGKVMVNGCYLGLLTPSGLTTSNRKVGILFHDYPQPSPFVHVYNNNRSLFEMVLGASHGSADGYFTREQWSVHQTEFARNGSCQQVAGYSLFVATVDLPEERKLYNEHILPLQKSYLAMAEQMTDALVYTQQELPSERWFAEQHARMLFSPSRAEVDFFSGLYHLENFGLFEYANFARKDKLALMQRLKNLNRLRQDPAAILETGVWPPIILRRLGLDFLIPLEGKKRYRRIFGDNCG